MKIESPKEKKTANVIVPKSGKLFLVLLLMISAFVLGFIFNHFLDIEAALQAIKDIAIQTEEDFTVEIRHEIGLYNANGLETLFIDIPFESLIQIEEKRNEALAIGYLLTNDADYVPATLHLIDDENINIKIRLKGDWVDHLQGDKWSFRIHIRDDNAAVFGIKRFSIQAPETRIYVSEWGNHQNLFMEGILSTRYFFVNIIINGEYKGIYALEESFTEDLLESQGKREGVIFRLNEDLMWKNWENLQYGNDDIVPVVDQIGFFWLTGPLESEITAFREGRISRDEFLESELISGIDLLYSFNQGLLSSEEVFDEELWGRFFAVTDLWGAGHGTAWHNLRFYYNPITGLLEPVVFDSLPTVASSDREELAFPLSQWGFIQSIFRNPEVQRSYVETLERITSDGYLDNLKLSIGEEYEFYHGVLSSPLEIGIIGNIADLPWEGLRDRAFVFSRNLTSPQPIQSNYQIIETDDGKILQLDIVNLMALPVQLNQLVFGETTIQIDKTWCDKNICQGDVIDGADFFLIKEDSKVTIQLSYEELEVEILPEGDNYFVANLYGGSFISKNPITSNYVPKGIEDGVKPIVSLAQTLAKHAFLYEKEDGLLSITPGNWYISGDLVIPKGYDLLISGETSLRFGEGSILLVNGKLDILGSFENPVLLTSQGDSWGGVVVLNADEESIWQYVNVEKTAGIARSGWVLTGGITFYESPLDLSNAVIGNNTSEDAINIIRTTYIFDEVEFLNTISDAFDGDFTEGIVTDSVFHDIGGDAIDLSGSLATIIDTSLTNIGDKGISAGEKSFLTLENLEIANVNIGIASKDSSEVLATSIQIDSARIAGFAAYLKKPQYGPGKIEANNIVFLNTELKALCQLESVITLNGEVIKPEEIDVNDLYDLGILGN